MSKILVTGATGFLGRAVVSALQDKGHDVIAFVYAQDANLPRGVTPWHVPRLPALAHDAIQRMQGIDAVVHAAGRAHELRESASDPLSAFRKVNTEGTIELARAAAKAGVRRFVFVSSIGVNGSQSSLAPFNHSQVPNPESPYAQSKYEAEQALDRLSNETSMTVHHVRPPMIYGPAALGNFALLARLVSTGLPLPFGRFLELRSFVARENVVSLLVRLVEHPAPPSGVYLVADRTTTTTAEFVRSIAKGMGRNVVLLPVPVPVTLLMGIAALLGRTDQVRKMSVPLAIDIESTVDRLDWRPPVSMEQAMHHAFSND